MQVPSPTAFERRERRQVAVFTLALALVAALVIPVATFAGRGNTASTPWIQLSIVAGARLADGAQPSLGSEVTFAAGYPNNVNNPRIYVHCYQDGELVFGMAGGVDETFLLGGGGSIWLDRGGPANCKATLFYYGWHAGTQTYVPLAETSFDAG